MFTRVAFALASAALFAGSLQAQQMRTFSSGRSVPAPHFGAAYHPVGPVRAGVPAATSGARMFVPTPRRFVSNPYPRQFQVQNQFNTFHDSFRGCYFNANCRHFHHRFPVYGYGYGYPVVYSYPVYADAYYDNSVPEQQPVYQQPAYNDNSAETNRQLDRLTYEVEQLRADQESARQAQQRQEAPAKDLGSITPTVLVFSDGHRMEINNYAIIGKTLWILGDHTAMQKISIDQLDVPATKKANDENGVEFNVP